MVGDPRGENWKAMSNLAVGAVNGDAGMRHVLSGREDEFEYIL